MSKILFFDTETTGVPRDYKASVTDSENWPRLVQLGWIVSNINGEVIKERNYIIRPIDFIIPEDAAKIHGITTYKANCEGYDLVEVLIEFMHDLDQVERIVGHNISFDQHIVGAELCRLKFSYSRLFSLPVTCTMLSSINYCKLTPIRYGQYKWPRLEELYVKLFGCTFEGVHDAMADITATKKCYFELIRLRLITDYTVNQINSPSTPYTYTTVIKSGYSGALGALYKLLDNGDFIVFELEIAKAYDYLFWEFPFKDDLNTKKKITKVIIKEGITHIDDFAFEGCSSFTLIEIPSTLVSIGERPFVGCTSLKTIVVAKDNPKYTTIDGILYSKDLMSLICCPKGKTGEVIIPDEVVEIEEGAFGGCELLTSVIIPDTVTKMGEGVFCGCELLSKVRLSVNIKTIESHTFGGCSSLETITIPKGVTWIGVEAFSHCSSLVTITIPNSVRRIAHSAFSSCRSLSSVTIPQRTKIQIDSFPLSMTIIRVDENGNVLAANNKQFNIFHDLNDDGVLSINGFAEIYDTIEFDKDRTKRLIISDDITCIGAPIFQDCRKLRIIEIGKSIEEIIDNAFAGCENVLSITIASELPPIIGPHTLDGIMRSVEIRVPYDSIRYYQNARYWNEFTNLVAIS